MSHDNYVTRDSAQMTNPEGRTLLKYRLHIYTYCPKHQEEAPGYLATPDRRERRHRLRKAGIEQKPETKMRELRTLQSVQKQHIAARDDAAAGINDTGSALGETTAYRTRASQIYSTPSLASFAITGGGRITIIERMRSMTSCGCTDFS